MPAFIVTLKVDVPKGSHDPQNKKTGPCLWSPECTDVTGAHHSTLVVTESKEEAAAIFGDQHVTRVEEV
jgi:hypothetical protein